MGKSNSNKWRVGLLALLFVTANVNAGKELIIDPLTQMGTSTCWAACTRMVLRAYDRGDATSEAAIRQWVFGFNADSANVTSGTPHATDKVIEHFSRDNIQSVYYNRSTIPECASAGCISESYLINEINGGRPILAGWQHLWSQSGHLVLIRGYTGTGGTNVGKVIYNDPNVGIGGRKEVLFSEFVIGNDYYWDETLVLITSPRTPIPVSIGPKEWVQISNSTTAITMSPQTLIFNAYKSGDAPINWSWKLAFPHADGTYIAASWAYSSSNSQSTWNIPNFVLPTNYLWKYNLDGKIPGRAEVTVNDVGGPPAHDDAINVFYVPSGSLYPGYVIYANQTVSGMQTDVKAHEQIKLKNDIFLSGSRINFKAGEKITIEKGINFQAGSAVNFTVDPSIR